MNDSTASPRALQMYGPGYTGMQNLGNSCYMASVMQSMFVIPEFQDRFYAQRDTILASLVRVVC